MSHRIDIELTSNNGEVWTWRAAGAKQPKGSLDSAVLYSGAGVGDVVRAEAERFLDGLKIVSVIPPKGVSAAKAETIEIRANDTHDGPQVRVQYAEGSRARRDEGGERRGPRPGSGPRPDRPARDRPAGERGPRPERAPRPERGPRPERTERPARADGPIRSERPKRLTAGRAHRDALIDTLSPEQRVIADQLFRGGIPAVRQAIIDQNAARRTAGEAEVPGAALLALAEDLLPKTRSADWCDRAEAALAAGSSTALRDLRALVTQADSVAKDDAGRAMATRLRDAMTGRVESERTGWADEITAAMNDGKLVRALRLTTKAPDPAAKLPAEVQARLVTETNAALSPTTSSDLWSALLGAAVEVPFRRELAPVGIPADAPDALKENAAQASNKIPALLKTLGLTMPPPPRRIGASAPTPPPRAPRPVPAPPAVTPAPAPTASVETPAATPPPPAATPAPVPTASVETPAEAPAEVPAEAPATSTPVEVPATDVPVEVPATNAPLPVPAVDVPIQVPPVDVPADAHVAPDAADATN